jgi:uncharacterized membrane protein YccC
MIHPMQRLHRPRRSQVEFAAKAGVAAAVALWVATAVGLADPYWAAVSAVVATAGTLGASVGAAVTRVVATLVALAMAVAVVFVIPNGGVLLSGALVAVVLLVMFALSLDAGARLAAGSTMIVTAASGGDPLGVAVSRGVNVPLGCAIAVVIGLVLLPRRAGRQLADDLAGDQERAIQLGGALLATYVSGQQPTPEVTRELADLGHRVDGHRVTLADAGREPGSGAATVQELADTLGGIEAMLDIDVTLSRVATAATDDRAPELVAGELTAVATVLGGGDTEAASLGPALASLDDCFAAVRERRGTVDYGTEELARLLTVIRLTHNVLSVLNRQALT